MKEFATNLIINGPKIGGSWDKIIRGCELALETVKPGSVWRRRAVPESTGNVIGRVERYTLNTTGRVGSRREIGLTRVTFKGKNSKGIRGDVFLKDFVPVEAKP